MIQSTQKKMPSLFIGHGSPMNIVDDNNFTKDLKKIVGTFEKPKAIVIISAHWYTNDTLISNSEKQKTIYDFYGFPNHLYNVTYEPKGDTKLASYISDLIDNSILMDRGLDHGAWSILQHMYPNQDIPTLQLSINQNLTYKQHFEIGYKLQALREKGILIIGSGNITHNLQLADFRNNNIDNWAITFDQYIKDSFSSKNFHNITNIQNHNLFKTAHPFDDHFIPLLYTAGTVTQNDEIEYFHEEIVSGNLAMRCIKIG